MSRHWIGGQSSFHRCEDPQNVLPSVGVRRPLSRCCRGGRRLECSYGVPGRLQLGGLSREKTARGFPQIVSEMAGNRKDWDASDIGAPPNRPLALDESRGKRR
jgi:hypothetical protein